MSQHKHDLVYWGRIAAEQWAKFRRQSIEDAAGAASKLWTDPNRLAYTIAAIDTYLATNKIQGTFTSLLGTEIQILNAGAAFDLIGPLNVYHPYRSYTFQGHRIQLCITDGRIDTFPSIFFLDQKAQVQRKNRILQT